MENTDLKLVQRAAKHWESIAEQLRLLLDKKEEENSLLLDDNRDLTSATGVLRAQVDTFRDKLDSPEYVTFLEQLTYDKELELEEFQGLRVQVAQMQPSELLKTEQKRLVRRIDGISSTLFNIVKLSDMMIADAEVDKSRGQQPFPDIYKSELRERINKEKGGNNESSNGI